MTRLRWLETGPVEASPAAVKAQVAKLEFLRQMGAHTLDLSVLPAERRRFLATAGRRMTAQALARREPQRRYPILLTLVAQSAAEVLDEVVQLFDQAVSARESKAARKMRDALAERGKAGEDRQVLLDSILAVAADPAIPDDQVGGLIRGEAIGWERLRAARAAALPPLPRDHGHLAALEGSYGYLRQFTPQVIDAVPFAGGTAATELLKTIEVLRELNADGAGPWRRTGQVRAGPLARLRGGRRQGRERDRLPALLGTVRAAGATGWAAQRRCVGSRLAPLRRPGYLLTPARWAGQRAEFCPAGRQTRCRRCGACCRRRRVAPGAGRAGTHPGSR